MKKIIRNSRIIAIAFLTFFHATASSADSSIIRPVVRTELKFAGMINNDPLFLLNVGGDPFNDEFSVSITDKQGTILYRENFRGGNFSKKFLLNTEELGDEILLFEILNRKAKKAVIYEISSKGHYVSEITVNLIK